LVLPVIPFAMLFGTLAVIFSFIWPIMITFSLLGYSVVSYILFIVDTLASFSFALYEFKINAVYLTVSYVVIFGIIFFIYQKNSFRLSAS
jgi:hypothetical protein